MKKLAIALGLSLLAPTFASAAPTSGGLPAGKPAGVKQAQETDNTTWYVLGGLVVAGIIIAVASGGDSSSSTAPVPTQH